MFKLRLPTQPKGPLLRLRASHQMRSRTCPFPCARQYGSTGSKPPAFPTQPQSRADKILSRLPRSLQKHTTRLRGAPISHVVAFLILHEITAVIPIFALFGLFHYTDYVPLGYMMDNYGGSVKEGVGRFERYFRRKGWFGFGAEDGLEGAGAGGEEVAVMDKWDSPDGKYRIVVEIGLAYAITKAMLPVRILASLWATPWFAGLLARIRGVLPIVKKK
ncbi:hypothetical protein N0V93_006152 [Gnomoniopsis smithogilvyi]|uniref:Uncharacterized protein n=1 Tax=Gnomoniopsis smithogilvyi TaxID=1191159 RepID=A0A9W8YR55_9PEZI|nr:hypothetical protein N0V93_006152 [Gnomoniopsis smithogilvyi]